MASNQIKRTTVTEADIEEFIENFDDGEYYPDSEFSDNDVNDEERFCNFSDTDDNNTDDIPIVRNEVPMKFTFKTLSKTLNEQNYDSVVRQERKIYEANVGKGKVLNGQQINQMFPENEMNPTLFAIKLDRQDVQRI